MKHLHFYRSGIFIILIPAMFVGTEKLFAQVTVAPSILFIDSKSGVGNLYITNNSAFPQEVNINFVFGYPDADSMGNVFINYKDSIAAGTYSLDPFVKAYPRSFLLNVKEEQTVRLQVRTTNSIKDTFLFTRLKVTSAQKSTDIEKKITEAITTQVNFKFEQILPVYFHKGSITTGLNIHDISVSVNEKKLTTVTDLERTGNAPFIGSVKAVLYSTANTEVARFEQTASIFFRMKHKVEFDISNAGKGEHRLVLTFDTKRSDIAVEDLLQAPPVTKEVTVNLP